MSPAAPAQSLTVFSTFYLNDNRRRPAKATKKQRLLDVYDRTSSRQK
jgi:hypothetical protein